MSTEIEVTAQHMTALKALADTNLKVSEAKNILTKLQETETEYLISREKKALDRIQKTLELSHNLVEETNKNYDSIERFSKDITNGAAFLSEAHEKFTALIKSKDECYSLWEKNIQGQEETIVSLMKGLKIKESEIESGQIQLNLRHVQLDTLQRRLSDEKGAIDRKIEKFKQGKI